MDAASPTAAPGSESRAFPARGTLAIAALASLTVLLTWRASLIESSLSGDSAPSSMVDHPAPDFSASTLDGRTVSLADFRGQKNVVVAFWASWCAPCRVEMPAMVKFYETYHGASSDFEILAVTIDDEADKAAAFAKSDRLTFPVLLDLRQTAAAAFHVSAIPTMFVIDKNGRIVYGHAGVDLAMEPQLAHHLHLQIKPPKGFGDVGAGH
jgi:peroxiredoxin